MTDQQNSAPAVWDPTARGGAGGWVRNPQRPADDRPAPVAPEAAEAAEASAAPESPAAAPGPATPPPPARAPHAPAFPPQPAAAPPRPPYGDGDADADRRAKVRRAALLVGFAVVLVLAVVGGIIVGRDADGDNNEAKPGTVSAPPPVDSNNLPPVPAPTAADTAPATPAPAATGASSPAATTAGPAAKAQAQAVNDLLATEADARASIGNALAKISSCPAKADIESTAKTLEDDATRRDGLLTQLTNQSVTDLPGGVEAVNSLKSYWQSTSAADRAYAGWARALAGQGCTHPVPSTPEKTQADGLVQQAATAKGVFSGKWHSIATTNGITPPTQDRI
ncbi:hypothetical protein [Kitasatospora brasiliensis]|uniref:hypothetical protein n=1 Tax=Kitasatospora brasiliensis TaxID=3058040 RepID=UPI0029304E16|nr:hypothetical protein [Kitasatospora sp. K002]